MIDGAREQPLHNNEVKPTLIINDKEVEQVHTIEDTIAALEQFYLQLAAQEAVCRPRIDIRIPTSDSAHNYQWGTMVERKPSRRSP